MVDVTASAAWKALQAHHDKIAAVTLRDLFAAEPDRVSRLGVQAGDLYIDFSKHRIQDETVRLLVDLATEAGLTHSIADMFSGRHINTSEDRAVLHTALRSTRNAGLFVDGQNVVRDVHIELDKMGEFTDRLRSGKWTGATGERITTVVNIGIGGSDLGPAMAYDALSAYLDSPIRCRFVSNIDPADIIEATRDLDPASTLFIVCSKTFTTLETLTNAKVARQWLLDGLGAGPDAVANHFVAVSTNAALVREFGIDEAAMFGFWDWVGGRYSVGSAVGLSLMCAIGRGRFDEFLTGFRRMDEHFRTTELSANGPALLGLLGVWYSNFFGAQSKAVLPYSNYLRRFPAYLQQLTMESNGKSVRSDGTPVSTTTGEIYWGEPGTNGQHAFYQLLHQGTWLVPADFIGFAEPLDDRAGMHDMLMSNFFAQSAVLAFGQTAEELAAAGVSHDLIPHKVMPGNRPGTTILAPRLTPSVLGELIGLYEHAVFTEGVIWGINSFDQWGVQLGKTEASGLLPALVEPSPANEDQDGSTKALISRYRQLRGRALAE